MRREIYFCLLLCWLSFPLGGQTALFPGDIAIVGIQTDNPDNFSFVFLTSIQKHTVVYFTDCGVKMNGTFRSGEGGLRYTAPDDLATGTLVNYIRDSSDFSKANDPILGSRGFNLSSSGDQIIAFQDSSIRPRFLFALQTNSSKWQVECTNTNVSCLPPGLKEGYSAICTGKDTGSNNCWHNAIVKNWPSANTRDKALSEICQRNNWTFGNSLIPLPENNLNLLPDSNRYIKFLQDNKTSFYMNDSLYFDIVESNINRLSIWIKNINLRDSFLLQNHWPSFLKNFRIKFPCEIVQDSFQLLIGDADFPGFLYRSGTMIKKDTVDLLFVELIPHKIKPGDSITLKFNKAFQLLRDSLILRNIDDHSDSIILTFSSGQIHIYENEISLQLKDVKAGTFYKIELRAGWMSDLFGNAFNGIDASSYPVFEVTREINPDTIAPSLVSIEPSLELPLRLDQSIRFVFNEPLYSAKGDLTNPNIIGDIISIHDSMSNSPYNYILEFDSLFTSFTILPVGLEVGKRYYISINGFSDSSGNVCEEFKFNFETEKIANSERINFPKETLLVFPNPAQNYLKIIGYDLIQSEIELLDITGKSKKAKILEWSNNKIILNISSLSIGSYIIQIENKNEMRRARFIKN